MRIANSLFSGRAFLLASTILLSGMATEAMADPIAPPSPPSAVTPVAPPMPSVASNAPVAGASTLAPPASSDGKGLLPPLDSKTVTTASPVDHGVLSAMENRTIDNAHNVIKHLDNTDSATVEDLNMARQAVARIEAMVAIETHLNELQKLRNGGGGGFASAIPASALMPPPGVNPGAMGAMKPHPVASSGYEISRIYGSDGKYSAVLKNGGETHTVKVGDKLDGVTVRWISPSSVLIEQNGTTHSLHIKNVDTIYSAMR